MSEEYDLHLSRATRDRVWKDQYEAFTAEDDEELDRIIQEETGLSRPRKRKKKQIR